MPKLPSFSPVSRAYDEHKLRQLAVDLAKDIADPLDILKALGFTPDEFEDIKDTRAFKQIYTEALGEWQNANNTHKRVKLKAAATVEYVLPEFYREMQNKTEPLSARTELLKTIARIGGLGNPEPLQQHGGGQYFKLEIHLDGKPNPIIIGNERLSESALATDEPYDNL